MMIMKTPQFWYENNISSKWKSLFLIPISIIWIFLSKILQLFSKPYTSKLKVICIGNLTIGGTGKTPFAISTFKYLQDLGYNPAFLTRGYGGKEKGPIEVKSSHKHIDVGDEALLLSKVGRTIVSRNRSFGAKFIEKHNKNFDVIVMDDGLQNNQLKKNTNILLIDKKLFFGNKHCIPAGPLREPIKQGLNKINAIILTGNNSENSNQNYDFRPNIPIFKSNIIIKKKIDIKQNNFLAFCGLANPDKFYKTLKDDNFQVKKTISFPDHHKYTTMDIQNLKREASEKKLKLITTEKDYVKIDQKNRNLINVLLIELGFNHNDENKFKSLLKETLDG